MIKAPYSRRAAHVPQNHLVPPSSVRVCILFQTKLSPNKLLSRVLATYSSVYRPCCVGISFSSSFHRRSAHPVQNKTLYERTSGIQAEWTNSCRNKSCRTREMKETLLFENDGNWILYLYIPAYNTIYLCQVFFYLCLLVMKSIIWLDFGEMRRYKFWMDSQKICMKSSLLLSR